MHFSSWLCSTGKPEALRAAAICALLLDPGIELACVTSAGAKACQVPSRSGEASGEAPSLGSARYCSQYPRIDSRVRRSRPPSTMERVRVEFDYRIDQHRGCDPLVLRSRDHRRSPQPVAPRDVPANTRRSGSAPIEPRCPCSHANAARHPRPAAGKRCSGPPLVDRQHDAAPPYGPRTSDRFVAVEIRRPPSRPCI